MICDRIENFTFYEKKLSDKFKQSFHWITENFNTSPKKGKYLLQNGIFAIVDEYETKPYKSSLFENHYKYIDIQVIIEGNEWIFWTKPIDMKLQQKYSEENDIEFFQSQEPLIEGSCLNMKKGMFVILWPDDWHMPSITPDINSQETFSKVQIKKFVIKIPVI